MATERKKIGLREIRSLAPQAEIFDGGPGAVSGFGARRRSGPSVAYFVMYRTGDGRLRRFTIGTHGSPWTPDTARDKAIEILAEVKIEGLDPAAEKKEKRKAATVSELCDLYWSDAKEGRLLTRRGAAKKESTLVSDQSRIEGHIRPLLGNMKLGSVTRDDVERFMHSISEGATAQRKKTAKKRGLSNVRGGKGAATRTVGLLGAIFTFAERKGLIRNNPVRGVVRYADTKKERRLSDAEYGALGSGLARATDAAVWPAAVAAARFLALTGWRSGEALGLRWSDVDAPRRTVRLTDTKTGVSTRPLSKAACDVLASMGGGSSDALVFQPTRGDGQMSGFPSLFGRIAQKGELPEDVTPHVLRHSFASMASDLGYSEATIATLVGHKGQSVTSRYTHSADAVLLAAADAVAARITQLMDTPFDHVGG